MYDFVETAHVSEVHENYEDIIEDKIFKYKYRQCSNSPMLHAQRENRMVERFLERAKTRDPALEQDIFDLYERDAKDSSPITALIDYENSRETALEETRAMREYMAREGVQ